MRLSPASQRRRLAARCHGRCELALIRGARHDDLVEVGGPAYQSLVLNFLFRHLPVAVTV